MKNKTKKTFCGFKFTHFKLNNSRILRRCFPRQPFFLFIELILASAHCVAALQTKADKSRNLEALVLLCELLLSRAAALQASQANSGKPRQATGSASWLAGAADQLLTS